MKNTSIVITLVFLVVWVISIQVQIEKIKTTEHETACNLYDALIDANNADLRIIGILEQMRAR